ncbi:MAG: hypothetical protein NVS1B4_21830 [Gemmatimonadaceae bacterium]
MALCTVAVSGPGRPLSPGSAPKPVDVQVTPVPLTLARRDTPASPTARVPAAYGLDAGRSDVARDAAEGEWHVRQFLRESSHIVVVLTPDGRIVFANTAWYAAVGGDGPAAGGGQSFYDAVARDYRDVVGEYVRRAASGDRIDDADFCLAGADGRPRPVKGEICARFERESEGRPLAICAILRETTLTQRANDDQYRALFLGNGAVQFLVDPDGGRILDANPAALNFYGYALSKLTAMTIADLGDPVPGGVAPLLSRALTGQQSIFKRRHRLVTGEWRDVEVFTGPVTIDGRRVLHSIIHDVTERERATEELLQQAEAVALQANELMRMQEFLTAMLEHLTEGIVACDETGRITVFNSATREFHGLPAEPLPPEEWAGHYALFRPDGETPLATEEIPLMRALSGEVVRDAEMVIAPKGLPKRVVLASGRAIVDARGVKRGAVVAMHDVTERKVLDRMKNEFVSMVSHELRTPLTSIRGSLRLIEGGAVGELPEKARGLVRIARANADRLTRLINDVLDLEKMAAGKMDIVLAPVDPEAIARDAIESMQGMATEADVQLRPELAALPMLTADEDRLIQVLSNMLSNAIKYSPSRGVVVLRTEAVRGDRGDPAIRFSVADRGPGIPAAELPLLFQRFQQLGTPAARRAGGSGLGLAISRAIIEQHGGRMGVESVVGEGATFWCELPVGEQPSGV